MKGHFEIRIFLSSQKLIYQKSLVLTCHNYEINFAQREIENKEKGKLQIIVEVRTNGVRLTLEKYELYPAAFYYWKKKLIASREAGLGHNQSCSKSHHYPGKRERTVEFTISRQRIRSEGEG